MKLSEYLFSLFLVFNDYLSNVYSLYLLLSKLDVSVNLYISKNLYTALKTFLSTALYLVFNYIGLTKQEGSLYGQHKIYN